MSRFTCVYHHVHIMCISCAYHVHIMCISCAYHVHIMCMYGLGKMAIYLQIEMNGGKILLDFMWNCMHKLYFSRWHFSCADLLEMLSSTLTIEQDPENDDNTIQSTIVDGLGFYSAQDTAPQGFHIDEVSFSSEMRQFEPAYVSS